VSTRSFDYLRAFASGVLLTLSFPKFGHPAAAWIALTPLLVALAAPSRRSGAPLRHAFLLGLTTGVVYFAGTLYWITRVMTIYGGMHILVAVPITIALVAYLALFPALFALVVCRVVVAHGSAALMVAPLVWVATELGRSYLFTGFPWVLLGYSQVTVLPIAQLASLFGVYGLSVLVAAVSAALAMVALGPARRSAGTWRLAYGPAVVMLAVVVGVATWGSRRVAASEWTRAGDAIRVGIVQGNVDQAEKWNPARADAIFQEYLRMTREAIREGAAFVLWPESSTPFMFEEDPARAEQIRRLARETRVPILVGSDQVERGTPPKYFNAAFLIRPDGSVGRAYRKMHLVPFGEYVPLKHILFFAAPLVEAVSDFSAGDDAVLLPVAGHRISTAICYEIVYPDLVRGFVAGGSELLTTITNDAWYGRASAPYQHFDQASLRAIEEGRYLVRSANTGISGIVDPYGRVVKRTAIFESAVLVGEARFLRTSTFYARHGDIVAYAAVVVTAALLIAARRRVE